MTIMTIVLLSIYLIFVFNNLTIIKTNNNHNYIIVVIELVLD